MDHIPESLHPLGQPINRRVPPPFIEGARSQRVRRFLECCRTVRLLGQIQKLSVGNAMTYRLPHARQSNCSTALLYPRGDTTSHAHRIDKAPPLPTYSPKTAAHHAKKTGSPPFSRRRAARVNRRACRRRCQSWRGQQCQRRSKPPTQPWAQEE